MSYCRKKAESRLATDNTLALYEQRRENELLAEHHQRCYNIEHNRDVAAHMRRVLNQAAAAEAGRSQGPHAGPGVAGPGRGSLGEASAGRRPGAPEQVRRGIKREREELEEGEYFESHRSARLDPLGVVLLLFQLF